MPLGALSTPTSFRPKPDHNAFSGKCRKEWLEIYSEARVARHLCGPSGSHSYRPAGHPESRCRSHPVQRPIFPAVIIDVSILLLKMRQPINLVVHK